MGMDFFRASTLPAATSQYDPRYINQLVQRIQIYFSQLDSNTPQHAEKYTAQQFVGGLVSTYRTADADTAILPSDSLLMVDATDGPVTVTLPSAASVAGRSFTVKKIDASGNAVTLDAGSETIDGSSTLAISAQWDASTIQSIGTAWAVA